MDAATTTRPLDGPLIDTFGRVADDLRISVTDRCNFRCTYCMPAEGLDWLPQIGAAHLRGADQAPRDLRRAGRALAEGHRRRADRPRRPAAPVRMFREVGPGPRHLHHDERPAPGPARCAAGGGRRRPRHGLVRLAAAPPVRRDDTSRRARPRPRGTRGGRGGRAHPHQDQHRRDRRDQRRRGRRLRAVGARDRLRGSLHRVHAARRRACVGAVEGRPGGTDLGGDRRGRIRSRPRTEASSRRRPTGSPTGRRARSV